MNRLIIYGLLFAGGAVAIWWYGESREEDGYNKAIAEHSAAVAEWHEAQKAAYQAALAKERQRAQSLESDLSTLRGDFETLQREVSDVPVVKPALPGVPDCSGYNPLSPEFGRMLNQGARGAFGTAEAGSDSGDGEMP